MNMKEAFRYQNKLQRLMDEAVNILSRKGNITKVENTALLHKVNPEAQDETTVEPFDSEYGNYTTEVAVFLMYLLDEKQKLSQAIRLAKQAMSMDFDGEVSLNAKRQAWGTLNPVTRKPESSKAYNRRKAQSWKKDLSASALSF